MRPLAFRRTSRALCASLILAAAALTACSGSPAGTDKVTQLSFAETVDVVAAEGDAPPAARDQGEAIVAMITDWYQGAFMDPGRWRDPKFPDVTRLFTGAARTQVAREIESVTIGEARDDVRSVRPENASVKVTVYVAADGSPTYAVADVSFHGTGTLKKKGLPLTIVQKGTYFLRIEDGQWRIFAYQARADQAQNPPSPSGAPS